MSTPNGPDTSGTGSATKDPPNRDSTNTEPVGAASRAAARVRSLPMRTRLLVPALLLASLLPACRGMPTAAKVVLTPLTVVRDVIDVPLVSITNVFHVWALASSPIPQPSAGVAA